MKIINIGILARLGIIAGGLSGKDLAVAGGGVGGAVRASAKKSMWPGVSTMLTLHLCHWKEVTAA